ncbi:MAG: hypothetical protein IPM93_09215 [Candidatus Obscuribacter sp.]|nr:hypothetical protein [Candidatus Obscuribacter sp.]
MFGILVAVVIAALIVLVLWSRREKKAERVRTPRVIDYSRESLAQSSAQSGNERAAISEPAWPVGETNFDSLATEIKTVMGESQCESTPYEIKREATAVQAVGADSVAEPEQCAEFVDSRNVVSGPDFDDLPSTEASSSLGDEIDIAQCRATSYIDCNVEPDETVDLANSAEVTNLPGFRAELYCSRDAQWSFSLRLRAVADGVSVSEVTQADQRLRVRQNQWQLSSLTAPIRAITSDGRDLVVDFALSTSSPFVFKLRNDLVSGYFTGEISMGYYLVCAPSDWQRFSKLSGPEFLAAESVPNLGMTAHYFFVGPSSIIAFENSDGEITTMGRAGECFELIGNAISDEGNLEQPLFGRELPKAVFTTVGALSRGCTLELLRVESGLSLSIKTWRVERSTVSLECDQSALKTGTYRLQLSSSDGSKLGAKEFRYTAFLGKVCAPTVGSLSMPVSDSKFMSLLIDHDDDCKVLVCNEGILTEVILQRTIHGTEIAFLPNPESRSVDVSFIDPIGDLVSFSILIPKVWWRLRENDSEPGAWQDHPLSLPAKLNRASSQAVVDILLPERRWARNLKVILSEQSFKAYRVKVDDTVVSVPLRDLCDMRELERPGTYSLEAEVDLGASKLKLHVADIVVACTCRLCGSCGDNVRTVLSHVLTEHSSELLREVDSDRLRQLESRLPNGIFKCCYCDTELVLKNFADPALALKRHLNYACYARPEGDFQLPVKIRDHTELVNELASLRACSLCQSEFDLNRLDELVEHFATEHGHRVLKLVSS